MNRIKSYREILIAFTISILFFNSCHESTSSNETNDSTKIIARHSSDGEYWIGRISKDSVKEGLWKLYDKDSILKAECNYIHGKMTGRAIRYFPSGQKSFEGYFRKGLEDSLQTYFYENGNVSEKYFPILGKAIGEDYLYYETGKIKEYSFYNLDGKKVYLRQYDTDGVATKSIGNAIAYVYLFWDTMLTVNDTMKVEVICATPPNCSVSLILNERNNLLPECDLSDKIQNNEAVVKLKILRRGTYQAKTILTFKDSSTNKVDQYFRAGTIKVE